MCYDKIEITGEDKRKRLIEFREDLIQLNKEINLMDSRLNNSYLDKVTINEFKQNYSIYIKQNEKLIEIIEKQLSKEFDYNF